MASVSIGKIEKNFGKIKVIHGISFDIADGEFVVLAGPAGCGKSILLRMLAGLEEINGGDIAIGGKIINDLDSKDRDIAMVFQSYALYPHMTVRDPKVFLFDEPLSNLDARLRVTMRAEIKALHQRLKTTTVYVTHNQIEAMTMADRIVVRHEGIIEQIGTLLELFDHPGNLFVAQFIGFPSMNVFDGVLRSQQGRHWVEVGAVPFTPVLHGRTDVPPEPEVGLQFAVGKVQLFDRPGGKRMD